jgi:hypothetical protein
VLDLSMMKTKFHKCTLSKHAGREGEGMSLFCLELGEIREASCELNIHSGITRGMNPCYPVTSGPGKLQDRY